MTGKAPVSCDCDVGCTTRQDQRVPSSRDTLTGMTWASQATSIPIGDLNEQINLVCRQTYQHLHMHMFRTLHSISFIGSFKYTHHTKESVILTFAVRSNATPSSLFLSVLSQIAVFAVPGCAANASMRLPWINRHITFNARSAWAWHMRKNCYTNEQTTCSHCGKDGFACNLHSKLNA